MWPNLPRHPNELNHFLWFPLAGLHWWKPGKSGWKIPREHHQRMVLHENMDVKGEKNWGTLAEFNRTSLNFMVSEFLWRNSLYVLVVEFRMGWHIFGKLLPKTILGSWVYHLMIFSWDDDIPNIWNKKNNSNHQPVNIPFKPHIRNIMIEPNGQSLRYHLTWNTWLIRATTWYPTLNWGPSKLCEATQVRLSDGRPLVPQTTRPEANALSKFLGRNTAQNTRD